MEEISDPFYCGEASTLVKDPGPIKRKQWRFKTREEFMKESGRFRGVDWNSEGLMDFLLGKNASDWIVLPLKKTLKFDPFDPTWWCEDDFEVYYEDRRSESYWYCSFQDLIFD